MITIQYQGGPEMESTVHARTHDNKPLPYYVVQTHRPP